MTEAPKKPFLKALMLSFFTLGLFLSLAIFAEKKDFLSKKIFSKNILPKGLSKHLMVDVPSGKNNDQDPFFYSSIGSLKEEAEATDAGSENESIFHTYTLELNKTSDQAKAEESIEKYKALGLNAYYTPLRNSGHLIFRIRNGVYGDIKMASKDQRKILKKFGIKSKVIQLE